MAAGAPEVSKGLSGTESGSLGRTPVVGGGGGEGGEDRSVGKAEFVPGMLHGCG